MSDNLDGCGCTQVAGLVGNFQCQGAWCFCTADYYDQLTIEKFHRWNFEGLQTGSITIADSLK